MPSRILPGLPAFSLCCALAAAIGCEGSAGDPAPSSDTRAKPQQTAGEGGNEEPARPDPKYVAVTRVWDDTTTTSYAHVVSSLSAETEVDTSRALEIGGPAKLFSAGDDRWFAIGGGEAPTITRYSLDDQGALKKGASISLQPHGVKDLWDALYFVSADKAYYPDTANHQLIVWNPSSMEVLGSIALPETKREGYVAYYGLSPIVRDKRVIFSVGWFDWETSDSVLAETGLVVIDSERDELERFDVDVRCAGISQAIRTGSGDTYFVSSALAASVHRLGRLALEPCALRVLAGEDGYDPDYVRKLKTLTGGALAAEPAPGAGEQLLLRVFDERRAQVEKDAQSWDLTAQAAWTWSRWNVQTDELSPLDALPPSTADVFWFRLDGKVYASETREDYSASTLIDLSSDEPTRALTTPGFLQNIARVR